MMLYVKPLVLCTLYTISLVLYSVTKHGEGLYRQMVIANAPRLPVHIYQCMCIPLSKKILHHEKSTLWSVKLKYPNVYQYCLQETHKQNTMPARGNLGIEICTLSHDKSHSCVFGQDTSITIY